MEQQINPCKCGSKKKPDLYCWTVQCYDCKQFVFDSKWTMEGALREWNNLNPIPIQYIRNEKLTKLLEL
jgi:hypothetical protein